MTISKFSSLKKFLTIFLIFGSMPIAQAEIAVDFKDDNKWNIYLGGYFATTATTIRVDGANGNVGTSIKAEENLAWDKRENSPLIGLGYRFNQNHKLTFSYWSLRRSGTKTLSAELKVGDEVYSINEKITSSFNTDIYLLTYEYKIYNTKKASVGLLTGLHVTEFTFKLGSTATSEVVAEATAPLPTIGMNGSYNFAKDWYVSAWFQFFSLEVGSYKGQMTNASVSATYRPYKNWAVSGGFMTFDLNLVASNTLARGEFDYEYTGPFFSIQTMF